MYEKLMEEVVTDENRGRALEAVKRNRGAAGIDGMKTTELENHLQAHWEKIRAKLLAGTYVPSPVRRVEIPKPNGGTRMLGIPAVQDRLIQQMLLQVLTAIFDPMFSEHSYGFRPGRSAQDAVRAAQQYAQGGKDWVVDFDIAKFFDTIPHSELMQCVARRIVDRQLLHWIKMWLKAPVEERDENGKRRLTGGQDKDRGTPQGGVISPALANLYLNRMLKGWRQTKRGEQFRAQMVAYADDFVILSRGKAKEALEWTRGVLERLDLTLNEKKTSIRNARRERFDFLGYTFGPHINPRGGGRYIGYSPSKKSVGRIKQKVGELLERRNVAPWKEVCQKLNRKSRGWRQYFRCGSTSQAYRAVDEYVYDRVRNFLRRRHKVSSQGTRQFPSERVYGPLDVLRLQGPRAART